MASDQQDNNPTENFAETGMEGAGGGDGQDDNVVAAPDAARDEPLRDLIAGNFIEYASYVVKERAIPHLDDGLKPVQRRILHSLYEMDDGRFHKVANVIGHSMQYHPHGDASINSALVVLANKEFYIEKQGNFGNIFTGDVASAARYIECRLSNLAREVLFNPELTEYEDSYDGRNREPVTLPAKVPSLLMLGAEGIAVGMSTRILPHNFCELLQAQISLLKGESATVYPDFLTGGIIDVSEYEDGKGRVQARARIEVPDKKTLVITEVPPGSTTESLINSIEEAVKHNKVKIASIRDFTAENVEIEIKLPRGVYADDTIKRLYAYTDCEYNLSSQILVVKDNRPEQYTVSELLRFYTDRLVEFLRRELEIEREKLHEKVHQKTLARIFIENRIYKDIEECGTYENVVQAVKDGLDKFRDELYREVTDEDIEKLLQLHIRRISRFDIERNRKEVEEILGRIDEIRHHLQHITDYAIAYLERLLRDYGDHYPRQTEIEELGRVDAREVAPANLKVGHDKQRGFVGSAVRNSNKADEYIACSEYDRLVVVSNDGTYYVIPVPEKRYVGAVKYVLKADKNQTYAVIYRDRKTNKYYAKRFRFDRYIMEREYRLAPDGCFVEQLYSDPQLRIRCDFKPRKRQRQTSVEVDLTQLPFRSAGSRGVKVADKPVQKFIQVGRAESAETGEEQEEGPENEGQADQEGPVPEGSDQSNDVATPETEASVAGDDEASETATEEEPPTGGPETGQGPSKSRKEDNKGQDKKKTGAKAKSETETGKSTGKGKKHSAGTSDGGQKKKRSGDSDDAASGEVEKPAEDRAEKPQKQSDSKKGEQGKGGKKSQTEKPPKRIDEDAPFFLE